MSMRLEKRPTVSTTDLQEVTKDEVTERKEKKVSVKEKISIWIKLITVEPALFAYIFASLLAAAAAENLKFEMTCRVNVGLNDTICSNYTLGLNYISGRLSIPRIWSHIVSAIISGILVLCFSTYSDRYKIRKPFFVLPMLGEVFSCLGLFLCVFFINTFPVEICFVFASVLPACFGGGQTIIMAINSYIADISTVEERTTRVGIVEIVSLILTPIAPALGGILYSNTGYYGVFSICGILFLFSTIYGWLYIPVKHEPLVTTKNTCIDVFNIKTVLIDMFNILVRKRIGYRRCLLLLTYICYIMMHGIAAEGHVIYLYVTKQFNFNSSTFQYFKSLDVLIHILGMFLAIAIFVRKMKIPDLMLVIIAGCFKIISSFWFAFGKSVVMFYIGPLISMFSGIYIIALRSFVTKLVSQSEVAKAQAIFSISDMITPFIYGIIYTSFYEATKAKFAGALYILSAAFVIPPLVTAVIMNVLYKNDLKEETTVTNAEPNATQVQGIYNEGNDIETSKL